jgi:hypothetical protein
MPRNLRWRDPAWALLMEWHGRPGCHGSDPGQLGRGIGAGLVHDHPASSRVVVGIGVSTIGRCSNDTPARMFGATRSEPQVAERPRIGSGAAAGPGAASGNARLVVATRQPESVLGRRGQVRLFGLAGQVQVREINDYEGRRLLRVVRRGTGPVT